MKTVLIVAIIAFATVAIVGIIFESPLIISFGAGGITFSIIIGPFVANQ